MRLTDLVIQKLKPTEKQRTYWDKGFGIRVSPAGTKSFVVMTGRDRKLTTLGRYPDLTLKDAFKRARLIKNDETTQSTSTGSIALLRAVYAFTQEIQTTTRSSTSYRYARYLKLLDSDKKLSAVTREDVTKVVKAINGQGAQNLAVSCYKSFFNWCVREGHLLNSPIQGMRKPNKPKSRERVLTDDELVAIWNATDYEPYGHIVRVLILTALRIKEVTSMQVTDKIYIPVTKNHHPHTLPITPLVKEHLHAPYTFNSWAKEKKILDQKCGVTGWTHHDLRRTLASNSARLGTPIHITERILNHRSGTRTPIERVYNRYSYDKEAEEALLTHEAFILKLVNARSKNPSLARLQSGACDETVIEEATEREVRLLDSTHHSFGTGR
jgi:integrase